MSKATKMVRRLLQRTNRHCGPPVVLPSNDELIAILHRNALMQSRCEALRRKSAPPPARLSDLEYRVYSQFGDDGIIEYLASLVPRDRQRFIEFGVEDYQESNTRLLLERDNWSGLILDGSDAYMQFVRGRSDFWKFDLTADAAFITVDNVNELFVRNGFTNEIGLLSIDIDGNDYWVWEAIAAVDPLIVVCEYNAIFGPHACVTIPYAPSFDRRQAHWSYLYAGASLNALNHLAQRKGYRFLGCNSAGNNAYFVHESFDPGIPFPSIERGFRNSKFREARDPQGQMLEKRADECLHLIGGMPVVDVRTGRTLTVADCVAAYHMAPLVPSVRSEAA